MVDPNLQQQPQGQEEQKRRVTLSSFSLKHDDFVHDVQFDHYGRRIATCSSDQMIKVWERAADLDFADTPLNTSPVNSTGEQVAQQIADEMMLTNQWVCTFQIPSRHNGAIWRISWADPEFGQIIASCGMDQHVHIFKETETGQNPAGQNARHRKNQKEVIHTGRTWEMAWKTDINHPIEDIKFAPKSEGLVLAVAAADGSVRFFAPSGPPSTPNLNDWQMKFNQIKKFKVSCNCIAWNPAFDEETMVLCGYQESMHRQPHQQVNRDNDEADPQDSQLLLYKLSGTQQTKQFLQYGTQGQFKRHSGSINDIAWAPLAGRSFHMIVSSATDKRIIVWSLRVIDLFSEQADAGMFEEPVVDIMFSVGPSQHIPAQMSDRKE